MPEVYRAGKWSIFHCVKVRQRYPFHIYHDDQDWAVEMFPTFRQCQDWLRTFIHRRKEV